MIVEAEEEGEEMGSETRDEKVEQDNMSKVYGEEEEGEVNRREDENSNEKWNLRPSNSSSHLESVKESVNDSKTMNEDKKKVHCETKKITVYVEEEAYKRQHLSLIPRQCMSKKKHIDYLAQPKYKFQLCKEAKEAEVDCRSKADKEDKDEPPKKVQKCERVDCRKAIVKRVLPPTARIALLARPKKLRTLFGIMELASVLSEKHLNNLKNIYDDYDTFSPEMETCNPNKKKKRRKKKGKKKKKKKKKNKCPKEDESPGGGDSVCNEEPTDCQYSMAYKLVKSILDWECANRPNALAESADFVLDKLKANMMQSAASCPPCPPTGYYSCKSEQMRMMADVFTCWMAKVLVEMSGKRCGAHYEEGDDDQDDDDDDQDEEEVEVEVVEEEEEDKGDHDDEEEEEDDDDEDDDGDQCDLEREDRRMDKEVQCELIGADTDDDISECELETVTKYDNKEQQTDAPMMEKEEELPEVETPTRKFDAQSQYEDPYPRFVADFRTDLPFITFDKIFDNLYRMLEGQPTNELRCPIENRIHRATYEMLEMVLQQEMNDLDLLPRTKEILYDISGKLTKWLRSSLDPKEIMFMMKHRPEVESREIRNAITNVVEELEFVEDWTDWIKDRLGEARCVTRAGGMNKAAWTQWTAAFEDDACERKRKYLQAINMRRHQDLMIMDRKPVKTDPKRRKLGLSETTLRQTNFDDCHVKSSPKINK